MGTRPWNKGKTGIYTKELRERISAKLKGTTQSSETRLKKSMAISGRKQTLQHRENNRVAQMRRFPDYQPGQRKIRRKVNLIFNGGFHSKGEWENLKAQYDWKCPSCKRREPEIKLTRDHIIAISKGGSDNIENIQPLCRPCNSKKHDITIRY